MTIPETIGLCVALGALATMLGKGLKALLKSFHAEHVTPVIAEATAAVTRNADVTASLTATLGKSIAAQERGFERLGDIIADHETRITVLEQPNRPIPRIRRKAS